MLYFVFDELSNTIKNRGGIVKKGQKMTKEQRQKISDGKRIDLIGKRFGKLEVISLSKERGDSDQIKWDCKCDCGSLHTVTGESIRSGKSKSCGCNRLTPPNKNKDRSEALMTHLFNCTVIKRNKKFGIKTDIDYELFKKLSLSNCFYCGSTPNNKYKDIRQGRKISDTELLYNGLDRIDSSKGYTKKNVVSSCFFCNRSKMDMSQKDFYKHINKIYEFNFK